MALAAAQAEPHRQHVGMVGAVGCWRQPAGAGSPDPQGREQRLGDRQYQILKALSHGPHTINALIAKLDPRRPLLLHASLKRLLSRQLVKVTGRDGKHTLSAMVSLAVPNRSESM